MKIVLNRFGKRAQKIKNMLLMIVYAPVIAYRHIHFSLQRKPMQLHGFYCPTNYCIEGALNSLQWHVENALFVRLNKYPMLQLGKQEKIFNVTHGEDMFELECYGVKKRSFAYVHLNIIKMKPREFDHIVVREYNNKVNAPLVPIGLKKTVSPNNNYVKIKPFAFRTKVSGLVIISLEDKELSRKLNDVGKTKTLSEVNKLMDQS